MRISEKLQKHKEKYPDKPTFSYEYFVPKTSQGAQNLYDRMDRMYELTGPQFIDITWNAGGKKVEKKPIVKNGSSTNGSSTKTNETVSSFNGFRADAKPTTTDIIETCQTVLGLETCMHLTCTNMPLSEIDEALQKAYDSGCQNILALRGDPPLNGGDNGDDFTGDGDDASCFQYAKDLVKYIREKYGDHFDIGVAAYPEGHPEESNRELLLDFLYEKVECGADFMITQMFYDADIFIDWCAKVRARGITIPIIPGIMPITSYDAFLRRAKWCQINIPKQFLKELDPYQEDDQMVREIGTKLVVEMCMKLLQSKYVTHLHMYTMNLEKGSMVILQKIGALRKNQNTLSSNQLWRRSLNPQRKNEAVRPIFWQRRPYSYVARTSQWGADEFPNGRFGDPNSPAFGGLDLAGAQLIRQTGKRCLELWSQPTKVKDISDLIINYLNGDLKCLPWSDTPITGEVDSILHYLKNLNKKSIFTINSQPKVNGLPSSDKIFGWGPKNGFVYQKGYLEFLLPKDKINQFLELANNNEELTFFLLNNDNSIFYHKDGENGTVNESVDYNSETSTNSTTAENGDVSPSSSSKSSSLSPIGQTENGNKKRKVERKKSCDTDNLSVSRANAVTWGIFPGREVLQPTIVEKESFVAWRDEFYQILQEWKLNFHKFNAPESATLIGKIIDDYVLCNIVDNNFVSPENQIYSLLSELGE